MKDKLKTIDQYLATLDAEKRATLEQLRTVIRAAAPKAEECISYGMPTFKLGGHGLVAFGAGKNHCALYPMSGHEGRGQACATFRVTPPVTAA